MSVPRVDQSSISARDVEAVARKLAERRYGHCGGPDGSLTRDERLNWHHCIPDAEDAIVTLRANGWTERPASAVRPTLQESALSAALGYLMNAKIALETGAPKRTAIRTIEGGLDIVRAALQGSTS